MGRFRLVAWLSLLTVGACGLVDSSSSRRPVTNASAGASGQSAQGTAASAAAQPVTSGASSGGTSAASTTGGTSASTTGGIAGSAPDAAGSVGEVLGSAGGASDVAVDSGAGSILNLPPLPAPHPYRAIQIATGRYHSCALLEDHQMKCWGSNGYGQLGLGDTLDRGLDPALMGDALPTIDLGTGRTALSIAAGRYTTCAILDDHSAKCWGLSVLRPPLDDVGDAPGEMGDALAPLQLGGHRAKAFGLGHYDDCVARDDDSFFCGGTSFQFGDVPAASDAHLLSMSHDNGALGLYEDGSLRIVRSGLLAPALSDLASGDPVLLAAGAPYGHCVYRQSHQLSCQGQHDGLPSELPSARSIALSENFVFCAALDSGELHCWQAPSGLLFTEPVAASELRVKLPAAAYALSTSSSDHQCALLVDGRAVCWSWRSAGADAGVSAVGWSDSGAAAVQAVDLGTYPEP